MSAAQADFTDHYRWLTNKTMMGLRWVREFCPGARFVLKTDDDGFNVPQRFVDYLIGIDAAGVDRFVGGYCFTVMPDRRDSSKFYIPYSMYPDRYYPTYCSGPGYVLSRAAVADVVSVADDVLFLPMEDVFVSGVCRVAAGIIYTQIVGVAEDQRQMTRCNLAVWVKNGHNIYPDATPLLWARVVDADRSTDCAGRNATTLVGLILFVVLWVRHVLYIVRTGFAAGCQTCVQNVPLIKP
jgi:beta-1,3-galactosyltransferase 2